MSATPETTYPLTLEPYEEGVKAVEVLVAEGKDVDLEVRDDIHRKSWHARNVKENYEAYGGDAKQVDVKESAKVVEKSIAKVIKAHELGLLTLPSHPPTRRVFENLVNQLRVETNPTIASFAQPLIDRLLRETDYVQISPGDGLNTSFEKDLIAMISIKGNDRFSEILLHVLTASGIPGITGDQIRNKLILATQNRIEEINSQRPGERRQEDEFVLNLLRNENEGGAEAMAFFESLQSPKKAHEHYKIVMGKKIKELRDTDPSLSLDVAKEEAARFISKKYQEHIMHIVVKIYSTVLPASEHAPFDKAVQERSGSSMFYTANSYFNALNIKILGLEYSLSDHSDFDAHGAGSGHGGHGHTDDPLADLPYYQIGKQEQNHFVFDVDPKTGVRSEKARLVHKIVPTSTLETTHFKHFIGNLHLTADSVRSWVEISHNTNFLHKSGGDSSKSMIEQKAGYAHHMLPAYLIDQLYRLPFGEFIGAVRNNLNAYMRREMSFHFWKRDASLNARLFDHKDQIETEILKDLIESFRGDKKIPEWMIEPAIFFARTHLSMISLQPESIAGYGSAPVDLEGNPQFQDEYLKRLEIYRTDFNAEKWRSSDGTKKGGAFLPMVNRIGVHDKWHIDTLDEEGREIYKNELQERGNMAYQGRHYFDAETPLQMQEINYFGYGGLEEQRGWRYSDGWRYWVSDMIGPLKGTGRDLLLNRPDKRDMEFGWKRLENMGVTVLRSYAEELLFKGTGGVKMGVDSEGRPRVAQEAQYKNLFRYLYVRYFSQGVGKEGIEFVVPDENNQDVVVHMSSISTPEEFWDQVVKKILYKKALKANDEDEKATDAREQREKVEMLSNIVHNALTVNGFDHSPTDFIYIENPSYSQNGRTLMSVLMDKYITTPADTDEHKRQNEREYNRFKQGIKDIELVQLTVMKEVAEEVQVTIDKQTVKDREIQRNIWGSDLSKLASDKSEIREGKGYIVDRNAIWDVLIEKYLPEWKDRTIHLTPAQVAIMNSKVNYALDIYDTLVATVVKQPKEKEYELEPTLSSARIKIDMREAGYSDDDLEDAVLIANFTKKRKEEMKKIYAQARVGPNKLIKSRLMWSGKEIMIGGAYGNACFIFDDTIYQALSMSSCSTDTVFRTVMAVHNTQGNLKSAMDDPGKEGFLSVVSKAYRESETDGILDVAGAVRKSHKEESDDVGDLVAARIIERAFRLLRIDSRIDGKPLAIANWKMQRKPMSIMSKIVKESGGELGEYAMGKAERYYLIKQALHKSLSPKQPKNDEGKVYDRLRSRKEAWGHVIPYFGVGEMLGGVADVFLGPYWGKLVRNECKEATGDGMRQREVASLMRLAGHEIGQKLPLIFIVIMIMFIIKGYKGAEEAQ